MKNKILIVEDDLILAETLKDFFEEEEFDVIVAEDGQKAVDLYKQYSPDLLLSDVALPIKNGFQVIDEIRKENTDIPIILMTGSELEISSQIKGYKLGIVNYLQKPVVPQVVMAQIKSLLKSGKESKINNHIVSVENQLLIIDRKQIILREKDSLVFSLLLKHINKIVERKYILINIWGNDQQEQHNLLDKSVSRLRKILKDYPSIRIKSVYATGYMLTGNNIQ